MACAFIAAIAAVLSAAVSARADRRSKNSESMSEMRRRENLLMMDMIHANIRLSVGTAAAIKNGRANGELESGLEAVSRCDEKYNEFMREIAIERIIK